MFRTRRADALGRSDVCREYSLNQLQLSETLRPSVTASSDPNTAAQDEPPGNWE